MQIKKDEGIGETESEAVFGEFFINEEIGQNTKGNIDDQGHITDTEAGFVLHHGGDAVETGRSKTVFHNKELVVESQQNSDQNNVYISKGGFDVVGTQNCHGKHRLSFSV